MRKNEEAIIKHLATTNGALALFPLNNASGNVTNRLTTSMTGTVSSGVTRITNDADTNYPFYFRFKGADTSKIVFNHRVIPPNSSFTFKFSVRMRAKPTGENSELFSQAFFNADSGIRVWVTTGGAFTIAGYAGLATGTTFSYSTSLFTFDNKWHDFVLSYNHTTGAVNVWRNDANFGSGTVKAKFGSTFTHPLTIGRQANTSYNRFFNGDLCGIEVYNKVLTPDNLNYNKAFIKHENEFKAYVGNEWVSYGTELTDAVGLNGGITSMSVLDAVDGQPSPLDQLEGPIQLYCWGNWRNITATTTTDVGRVDIVPKYDTILDPIGSYDSISIIGSPDARVVFSINSGETWIVLRDDEVVEVQTFEEGMTVTEVNALTGIQLNKLLPLGGGSLRLGYNISSNDTITSAKIFVNTIVNREVTPTSNYDLVYDTNTGIMTLNIKVDGSYTVNYLNTLPVDENTNA